MKIIGITGGSGFIGKHLTGLLVNNGFKVIIFTREHMEKASHENISYTYWDATKGKCDLNEIRRLDAIVHLAGAGIADKRWTAKRKKEIVDSRVKSTQFLLSQLKTYAKNCKTIIAASAIGFYGPDRDGLPPFTEEASAYHDFLGDTCVAWEKESQAAHNIIRTVILRFGIVLGKESGAYPQFANPLKFGIKPVLGGGQQVVSWVHIDDLCNIIVHSLGNDKMKGIYNAVAPNPVTQKGLMNAIASAKGGLNIPIPVPAVLLKVLLGGVSTEVLKSCTVSSNKVTSTGYNFSYNNIQSAVNNLVKA